MYISDNDHAFNNAQEALREDIQYYANKLSYFLRESTSTIQLQGIEKYENELKKNLSMYLLIMQQVKQLKEFI